MKDADRRPEHETGEARRAGPSRRGEVPAETRKPRKLGLSELDAVVGGAMTARNPKSPSEGP